MESDDEYQSDIESTYTDDTPPCEEDEEPEYTPEPTLIETGDGIEDVFKIISYSLDHYNIPCKTGYIEVFHSHKFKEWWTNKIKSILLKTTFTKNKSVKAYECKFRLLCSSDRDPGRWSLVIPAKEKRLETIWQDERQIAEIKIQIDWRPPYKRRMMIFMYLKSDSYSSLYQHYADQLYLTQEEYDSLKLAD